MNGVILTILGEEKMSMHLEGPWLSTTGRKRGKQKFRNADEARKARELAEEWQRKLINDLQDENYIFLNPRRNDWDSTWEQKITNPNFYEQVNWELNALECSDVIVMYFDPNTMSPITLLELGIHAKSRKLIVYCPEGFWRKGNVDIVCEKYNIKHRGNRLVVNVMQCVFPES